MSDVSGGNPDGWPPPQGGGEPSFLGSTSSTANGSVRSGSSIGRLALVATVLVVAAAGGFALWRALSTPSGPASPGEAAAELFEATDDDDIIGLVEVMLPSERESIVEPLADLGAELARLGVLSDDAVGGDGLLKATGLTVDFAEPGEPGELVYEIEPLGGSETVHLVTVTGGEATTTYDPSVAKGLVGEALLDWIGADLDELGTEIETETVDYADDYESGDPFQFAVVEEDGGWYPSLWYTVAAVGSDFEGPDLVAAPTPAGASTADEAVTQFLTNVIELDAAGAVTLLDPREFRALYDYWGHFGPELVDELALARDEALAEGFEWSVESVAASAGERNGRTVATIDALAVRVISTSPGAEADLVIGVGRDDGLSVDGTLQGSPLALNIDGERASGSGTIEGESFEFDLDLTTFEGWAQIGPTIIEMRRDGECLIIETDGEQQRLCEEDLGIAGSSAMLDAEEDWEALYADLEPTGLTVVERDGSWYVSGFPTVIHTWTDFLKVMDREQFEDLIDSYGELIESLQQPAF